MAPDEPATAAATAGTECLNCGEPLAVPRPRFCPVCGQETNLRPPRLGEFLQQFGGAYFATEGALWRTLKLLLFKPGELTRQYLGGRRKHYVLPLRLYLTISLAVLLLLRVVAAVTIEAPGAIELQGAEPASLQLDLGVGRAGLQDGVFFCTDLPGWLCRRIQRRIDVEPKLFAREVEQFGLRFVAHLGGAMFLLLPAFALGLQLVYRNRRLRYTERACQGSVHRRSGEVPGDESMLTARGIPALEGIQRHSGALGALLDRFAGRLGGAGVHAAGHARRLRRPLGAAAAAGRAGERAVRPDAGVGLERGGGGRAAGLSVIWGRIDLSILRDKYICP